MVRKAFEGTECLSEGREIKELKKCTVRWPSDTVRSKTTLQRSSTYIGIFQNPGIQHNIIDSISSLQSDYIAYELLLTVRHLNEETV